MRTLPEMLEHEIANEKKSAVQSAGERTNRGNRKQTGRDFGLGGPDMRTREEQIEELARLFSWPHHPDDGHAQNAEDIIKEAEQRGYERARAECAADTRRLEWLGDQCVHVYAPSQCAGGIGCGVCLATHKPEIDRNLRKAIDAAMEGGNG